MKRPHRALILGLLFLTTIRVLPTAKAQSFDRFVIDDNFPGAYQVEVADVNGDKRPDIIAVGGSTSAWYENPTWKKRVITGPRETPGIISSSTADLDGDGKAEIAIAYEFAMNAPRGASCCWPRKAVLPMILGHSPTLPTLAVFTACAGVMSTATRNSIWWSLRSSAQTPSLQNTGEPPICRSSPGARGPGPASGTAGSWPEAKSCTPSRSSTPMATASPTS